MNNSKEMNLYEYISAYDDISINHTDKKVSSKYPVSEALDNKIRGVCERKPERKKYKNISRVAASVAITVLCITGTGAIANAATDGKVFDMIKSLFSAQVITDDNRNLIGTEIVDDSPLVIGSEAEVEVSGDVDEDTLLTESNIVTSFDEELLLPFAISEFKVIDGITPEVIMTNGSAVVFYQGDYNGWKCNRGDKLIFEFEKYESEVIDSQTMVVGYVLDGVMYEGKAFRELNGVYELEVEKSGKYNLYVISSTSDYLTLKSGEIKVIE